MSMFLMFGINLKWKQWKMKDYHSLQCDALLLANVFEKVLGNSLKNYGLCPSHSLRAQD